MFRAVYYVELFALRSPVTMMSEGQPEWNDALVILEWVQKNMKNVTGGNIEQHITGLGWVQCNESPLD